MVSGIILTGLVIASFIAYKGLALNKTEEAFQPIEMKQEVEEMDGEENEFPIEMDVPIDKVWEFSFYKEISPEGLTDEHVFVLNEEQTKVDVEIALMNQNKTIQISPPKGGYNEGSYYEIHFSNQIGYVDGDLVETPFGMTFTTDREEVEEIVTNNNIITVEQKDILSLSNQEVEISKDAKKDFKVGDILILQTDLEGTAVKVSGIKEDNSSYFLTIEVPEFFELFERININKSYEILKEHITPIEGVTVEELALFEQKTLVAASNSKEKFEYRLPTVSTSVNKKGIEFKLENLDLDTSKAKLLLSGSLTLFKPEVNLDIDTKLLSIKKVEMTNTLKAETDIKVTNLFNEGSLGDDISLKEQVKKLKAMKMKNEEFELKVADIDIPIGGTFISGDIVYTGEINYKGEVEVDVKLVQESKKGIVYKKGRTKLIAENEGEISGLVKGSGKSEFFSGPKLGLRLKAYKIVGVGTETYAGLKISGEAAAGLSTETDGLFTCAKAEAQMIASGSAFVDIINPLNDKRNTLGEWKFPEKVFGEKSLKLGECEKPLSLKVSPVQVELAAGKKKEVKIIQEYLDVLSFTTKEKEYSPKNLAITIKDEDTISVAKNKKNLSIIAKEIPKAEKTLIEIVETKGDLKDKKVTIPVTITDFQEVASRERIKEELKNRVWEGEWYRNTHNNPAVLKISAHKGNTFQFEINAASGGNVGEVKGSATIDDSGIIAIQTTDEAGSGCMVEIHNAPDVLTVIESNESSECLAGAGVFFNGEYEKSKVQEDLVSLLVLDEYSDQLFRSVVGSDYPLFVNTVQFSENITDLDEMDASVWNNWVRGLNGYQNSIIMISLNDGVYAAVIDPERNVINYYANDEEYKNQLPLTIQSWKDDLDLEYEIVFK